MKWEITRVSEDMEKSEPLDIVGGIITSCSHFEKIVWQFLKKLNIGLVAL